MDRGIDRQQQCGPQLADASCRSSDALRVFDEAQARGQARCYDKASGLKGQRRRPQAAEGTRVT